MSITLLLVGIKPRGLINFSAFEGEDLLVAYSEGAANCNTTFKLKSNNVFRELSVCFGMSEVKGKCEIRNDTLFFTDVEVYGSDNDYYEFALIRESKYYNDSAIVRFENINDTVGNELIIMKNELIQ